MLDEPDGALLKRFVQGDREAFESLFRQFEAEVFQWVLRIVRDAGTAEDVVVEAFWRAYRGRARFDSSRSFGAWSPIYGDVPAPAASDPAVAESVARAFRTLPPRLRAVAALALIEEQPLAEIAEALELPIGTVKSRVFRAVRALRKELTRLGVRL